MNTFKKIIYPVLFVVGAVGFAVWDVFAVISAAHVVRWYIAVVLGVVGVFVTVYLGIVMHETGHLVFGLIGGMKFKSISFPFVRFYAADEKIKFSFTGAGSLLGACEMYPSGKASPKKAFVMESFGGLIGSFLALLLSVLCLALAPYISHYPTILFGLSSPVLYIILLENAFPVDQGGVRTDGGQILAILSGTPSGEALVAILTVQAALKEGKTPSEIPYELLFEIPQLPEDDPNYIFVLNYRYLHALDRGDPAAVMDADKRIRDVLDSLPDFYADQVLCDLFYDAIAVEKDEEFVRRYEARVLDFLEGEKDIVSCRIRGYYYFYYGDVLAAYREIDGGRLAFERYPLRGIAKTELRLLAELEAEIARFAAR